MSYVRPGRTSNSNEVKSAMLEKALVFRRKNRIYQHHRQIFIPHGTPLLSRAVKEIGYQIGLDLRGIELTAPGKRFDASNALPTELHRQSIVPCKIGKFRWPDIHRAVLHR